MGLRFNLDLAHIYSVYSVCVCVCVTDMGTGSPVNTRYHCTVSYWQGDSRQCSEGGLIADGMGEVY